MEQLTILRRPAERQKRRRGRPVFVQKYWAFLSYSHEDEVEAATLQRALEGYKVPRRLIGKGTPYGQIPNRLAPVFRDCHELAAGADLRENIELALCASRFLVVLCSPAAARSRWVDQEIRLFKQCRPDGEVLAAIISGEPWTADIPGRETEECFPPALKEEYDLEGQPTGERAEPLAADLRPGRDGSNVGLLKLIAGMFDIGLDDLVQRDAHRRHRRMLALTGGSFLGMVGAGALALTAIQSRDAARDQRREAESLIGFMLGDLKDRLEPIGRLDALDAVGVRALAYYAKQDRSSLSDESLAQRAKALTLMGELATSRGDLGGALARYREAAQSTGELISRHPENADTLFDHAQTVFWIGDAQLKRGELAAAERSLRTYKALAERMVALRPGEDRFRQERIYADSNLGVLLLQQDRADDAFTLFGNAVAGSEMLMAAAPASRDLRVGLIEALAWQAEAGEQSGRLATATALRRRQVELAGAMVSRPESDVEFRLQRGVGLQRLASLLTLQGKLEEAERTYRLALGDHRILGEREADNAVWASNEASARLGLASLLLLGGRNVEAATLVNDACATIGRLHRRDPAVEKIRVDQQVSCLLGSARVAQSAGDQSRAVDLAAKAAAIARLELTPASKPALRFQFVRAETLHAVLLAGAGDRSGALAAFRAAAASAPPAGSNPARLALQTLASRALGGREAERQAAAALGRQGYADPWLSRDQQQLAKAGWSS